jgi:predicted nuclease of restriction endonuclease-like (RecB) superfamily
MTGGEIVGAEYAQLLIEVKSAVIAARTRSARAVTREVAQLHWQIGRLILHRQDAEGWGTNVIGRLSTDLRTEFPGMRGFGTRSLVYMRTLASAYPEGIAQEPLAQLPWSHITVLLDKVPDPPARAWYAAQDLQHGWSAAVLTHHITTTRHHRVGMAPNNFPQVLPPDDSDQTREILQDPYALDFLALNPHHSERDLEDALVARLTRFLSELGTGFAFVGRQHKVTVGARDYYIDLLFYHLELRRFLCTNEGLSTARLRERAVGPHLERRGAQNKKIRSARRYGDSRRQFGSPVGSSVLCHSSGWVFDRRMSVSHQVWSGFQPASIVAASPSASGNARVAVVR